MARTIWKFVVDPLSPHTKMPRGARVLSIGHQEAAHGHDLVLWAVVDPNEPAVTRMLEVAPTGATLPSAAVDFFDRHDFVGTVTFPGALRPGDLVLHVFDGGEVP